MDDADRGSTRLYRLVGADFANARRSAFPKSLLALLLNRPILCSHSTKCRAVWTKKCMCAFAREKLSRSPLEELLQRQTVGRQRTLQQIYRFARREPVGFKGR